MEHHIITKIDTSYCTQLDAHGGFATFAAAITGSGLDFVEYDLLTIEDNVALAPDQRYGPGKFAALAFPSLCHMSGKEASLQSCDTCDECEAQTLQYCEIFPMLAVLYCV